MAGPLSPGTASPAVFSCSMAAFVSGRSKPVTTTCSSSVLPCGHFWSSSLTARTPSIWSGNEVKSVTPMRRWSTGLARRSSTSVDPSAIGIGRRMTAVTRAAQKPLASAPSRRMKGTRPALTRSPRIARVAGRNVRLPTTATRMTPIVPTAIERKIDTSIRNRPPIEIITARPLKNTARPAVLLAISIAPDRPTPRRRSFRKRVIMKSE